MDDIKIPMQSSGNQEEMNVSQDNDTQNDITLNQL